MNFFYYLQYLSCNQSRKGPTVVHQCCSIHLIARLTTRIRERTELADWMVIRPLTICTWIYNTVEWLVLYSFFESFQPKPISSLKLKEMGSFSLFFGKKCSFLIPRNSENVESKLKCWKTIILLWYNQLLFLSS